MLPMPAEEKALLNYYLTESARLMRKYTEAEKLKNFESIEVEVRNQMQSVVAPTIGEFFYRKEVQNAQGINES
jgi:hypothetical protein